MRPYKLPPVWPLALVTILYVLLVVASIVGVAMQIDAKTIIPRAAVLLMVGVILWGTWQQRRAFMRRWF